MEQGKSTAFSLLHSLGLDALLLAYLRLGTPLNGRNALLPPGWPAANNKELADPNDTVYINDEDSISELADISLLAAVIGSEVPQYRVLTANQGRPAGWQVVPSMWRITPFRNLVVLGTSTDPNQPGAVAARVTPQDIWSLIDKLERLR